MNAISDKRTVSSLSKKQIRLNAQFLSISTTTQKRTKLEMKLRQNRFCHVSASTPLKPSSRSFWRSFLTQISFDLLNLRDAFAF